ncbi:hypothetical protein JL720_2990 [Aureococcus anophagefferens]|nr:hypothetical protein JL720_2990 [Aureococcus anophagefferens]
MVVRVNYDGPWPPEQPAEGLHGDRYEVRGVVTKVVASAQLLHASRASGCLKHNAGAANVRTVAAISVAVDAAAASAEEAEAVEALRKACADRTDRAECALYVPATRLAALKAGNADSAAEAVAVGDVVAATLFASTAPAAAPASFPMFLDVDASGFADKIMSMTIAEQAPAPSTNDDVEDDEWDD